MHRRGEEPEIESKPWLELQGKATEPVRDVTAVKISMYPEEPLVVRTARPPAVGAIIQAKPELSVVLTWSRRLRPCVGARAGRAAKVQPPLFHQAALQQRFGGQRVVFE